ncbi:MAG: Glu/Leu/Phe/Val dehydrogenase [Actinomycetota bacterium]|nr:Glu/Leu/Phe/Val dehydrogenase [Actinomycetota bacterium]
MLPSATEVHRYVDVEGFHGFLAVDGTGHRLAAGGLRVQPRLDRDTMAKLAQAMTRKERLLGLAVDGAKAGLACHPGDPAKAEVMGRFLGFLRPFLLERLSLGPDLGTAWDEIERVARAQAIPSVKIAIARAQELEDAEFWRRLRLLDAATDGTNLGQRRAGHALAHAALAANDLAGGPGAGARVAVQGFGTLGRGAVLSLVRAGAEVTAVADENGCVMSDAGLHTEKLLATPPGTSVTAHASEGAVAAPPHALFDVAADVVVLAACEDAMTLERACALQARVVAVGANLGLAVEVEEALHRLGVLVVPDFVGGCGGSASMDALFGPPSCPTVSEVLAHVAARMWSLVRQVCELAAERGSTPRQAAMALCDAMPEQPGAKPYGRWLTAPAAQASAADGRP